MSSNTPKVAIDVQSVQRLVKVGQRYMVIKNSGDANAKTESCATPSSYVETRFENDIKTLISRADRLESLVERLLEANLANTELIGEMFKDLKIFMITKRVQTSDQLHERPVNVGETPVWHNSDEGTNINETLAGQPQVNYQSEQSVLNENVVEEVVEPPAKFAKRDLTHQIAEKRPEAESEYDPIEVIEEAEDDTYLDEKSSENDAENEYLEQISDEQPQQSSKTFFLPLKTIEELMIFDQELKYSENFQNYMKEVSQTNKNEEFRLDQILATIVEKKLIKKVGSRNNKSRFTIRKTYLCETFLYENYASPHMSRKDYINELNQILNTKPLRVDPHGIILPIERESDLKALENRLQEPEELKKFIQKVKLIKSVGNLKGKAIIVDLLSKILGVDLIMMHNWEGKHGKKKLAVYEKVFTHCMRTVADIDMEDFEGFVKKAIRTLQNREHIHISRVKKRLSTVGLE